MKSNRYLDQVSFDNLHNGGNSERAFTRLDYQATDRDTLRLNLLAGRSSFQLANLRSQHAAGQDQRQTLEDFSVSLGWMRVLSASSTFDSTASYRTTVAQLLPSRGDTPVTAAQARHLSTLTSGIDTHGTGRANAASRSGFPTLPGERELQLCLDQPCVQHPASDRYIPTLAAFDLSRGGRLFQFPGKNSGNFYSAFLQDNVHLGTLPNCRRSALRQLPVSGGLQSGSAAPGQSFHIRETGTVLRASYNRLFQTPPNENLLISNSEEASVLVAPTRGKRWAARWCGFVPNAKTPSRWECSRRWPTAPASTSLITTSVRAISRTTTTSSTPASSFRSHSRGCE